MNSSSEFLAHYGVKGMKWGVRRTQAQLVRAASKRKEARDPSTPEGAERARRKQALATRRTMDDGDLDKLVKRLETEKKLKNLIEDDLSAGKKASKMILSDTGKQIAKQVIAGVAVAGISVAIGNKFGKSSGPGDDAKVTPAQIAKLIRSGGKEKQK